MADAGPVASTDSGPICGACAAERSPAEPNQAVTMIAAQLGHSGLDDPGHLHARADRRIV